MSSLVEGFSVFVNKFVTLGNSIIEVICYPFSILKTMWFGFTSLVTGLSDLIGDVFGSNLFTYVTSGFSDLAYFIGTPAVIFISSLFLFVIIRMGIAFVFRIFRLNMDYKTMKTKWK